MSLLEVVQSTRFSNSEVQVHRAAVETAACTMSANLGKRPIEVLSSSDLRIAFTQIDKTFLAGSVEELIKTSRDSINFRLSRRMTSSGGSTTTRTMNRENSQMRYDIAIAGTLIYQTYASSKQATVCGVACETMLSALLRVMEHEMLHLIEMMLWNESSCAQARFKSMANRIFGHTASSHRLLTAQQAAHEQHGLRVGDQVLFELVGIRYAGTINRIQRRATVLVESDRGEPYSDGRRYAKYYVPLNLLRRA